MEIDFGTISPSTMCRYETTMYAIVIDSVCATGPASSPKPDNSGSTSRAIAGSPTKPRPMLANVMPTWHSDR